MTPVKLYSRLSEILEIQLYVKHDDLYPFTGGGSKARKIQHIIRAAKKEGCNALVSAGSANSNHARVVALTAAELGWKCKLIIHDKEDYSNGNLLLMKLAGAELIFCSLAEAPALMDEAMSDFVEAGCRPYYIWGGGHSAEGSMAFYEAFQELESQTDFIPDYIILPSGTGTTHAGLHVGAHLQNKHTKVIGISVARNRRRGKKVIEESIKELLLYLNRDNLEMSEVNFYDNWLYGGYAAVSDDVLKTIRWAAKENGLILDPTYTGKAFTALVKLIKQGHIPKNSKVIFWHTGGIMNLLSQFPVLNSAEIA